MKKLLALVLLAFAVETWGVYGAWQAMRITRECTLSVGPLCYAWSDNGLGALLGEKNVARVEARVAELQSQIETRMKKALEEKPLEIERAVDAAKDAAADGAEKVRGAIERAMDSDASGTK